MPRRPAHALRPRVQFSRSAHRWYAGHRRLRRQGPEGALGASAPADAHPRAGQGRDHQRRKFEQVPPLADRYEGQPAAPDAASRPTALFWEPTFHTADLDGVIGKARLAPFGSNLAAWRVRPSRESSSVCVTAFAIPATVPVATASGCRACGSSAAVVGRDRAGPERRGVLPDPCELQTFGYDGGIAGRSRAKCAACSPSACCLPTSGPRSRSTASRWRRDVDPPLVHFEGGSQRVSRAAIVSTASVTEAKLGEDIGAAAAEKEGPSAAADGKPSRSSHPARRG